ncbi:MAG: hypothetical protein IKF53_03030 [Clostridia bacterium]|nr:hypothetical protein [Clostridia bacterium]
MSDNIKSFKCPSCGSPIVYVPGSESLTCNNCSNEYNVDALIKAANFEKEESSFDWGEYKRNFEENKQRFENTAVYICGSCGAQIECEKTTAATKCPYCENVVVLSDRLGGGLKPNAVIPFAIDKEAAMKAVLNHFSGKKLLPNDFKSQRKLSKITGIYVPFWLFDGGIDGKMKFGGTRIRYYSDKYYDYTETRHYNIYVSGEMRFEKIPVDGSERMDDDLMDALEPFDYSKLTDFNDGYLSGFLADRFDTDPDLSLPRAENRMYVSAENVLRGTADDGFDTISTEASALKLYDPSVKYALLPVYLLNMTYKGKNYRLAVNGQTGKVVGELPISRAKQWLYTLGIASAIAVPISLIATWFMK